MAFSQKATVALGTNGTTIANWTDGSSAWEIASNALAKRSAAGSDLALVSDYSNTNQATSGEGDQKIKFRFTPNNGRLSFMFRYSIPGGTDQYIRVYWGLSNNIRVDYKVGGNTANQSSASWGLTGATTYDAGVSVVGTGASTVFTATIYDTSGTQVFQFILGTGGTAWTNTAYLPSTGDFRFLSDAGTYKGYGGASYVEYLTQGTAPTPTYTLSKTSTSSSTSLVVTPSGGVGSLTVSCKLADGTTHASGSPTTVASGTPVTFTRTGLTAEYHYVYYVDVVDEAAQSAGATGVDIFTRQTGIPTAFRVVGVGDSITAGPTTTNRPTTAARDIVGEVLGLSGTNLQEAAVATDGYTSGQIASLSSVVVDVVNGTANGSGNITGASLPLAGPADLVTIRLGKNDGGTAAETAANIQTVIDAIRAGCAHNPYIMLLPITGYPGSGDEGPMSEDRQYTVYDLLAEKEDVDDRILIGRRLSWWMFVWNPGYLPDSVHPLAAQIDILGQEIAWAYLDRVLPASVRGDYTVGSTSGGGGGTVNLLGGFQSEY